jgi:hypothetical protein
MIDDYFENLEKTILDFKHIINSYTIFKKAYNEKQGYIKGDIVFKGNSRLCLLEVKDTEIISKTKYRYQYMDKGNRLIFRYDNAFHHKELRTFPNHKHTNNEVCETLEPELFDILLDIQEFINLEQKKREPGQQFTTSPGDTE